MIYNAKSNFVNPFKDQITQFLIYDLWSCLCAQPLIKPALWQRRGLLGWAGWSAPPDMTERGLQGPRKSGEIVWSPFGIWCAANEEKQKQINVISWSVPEQFRTKHNVTTVLSKPRRRKFEVTRDSLRLTWSLTNCCVSCGFRLITGCGSASVCLIKRQLENALPRRLVQAEPTAWMQHHPTQLSPLLMLLVTTSVSGGSSPHLWLTQVYLWRK